MPPPLPLFYLAPTGNASAVLPLHRYWFPLRISVPVLKFAIPPPKLALPPVTVVPSSISIPSLSRTPPYVATLSACEPML